MPGKAPLTTRIALSLARFFWWVEEWCEATGNTFEDVALSPRSSWRSPAWYRRTRVLRGG